MEGEPLLRTETNSADDSSGVAFGLQGNLFLPVVAAGVVSIGLLSVCLLAGVSILAALTTSAIPFVATLVVVKLFLNDKPPHYMTDIWDSALSDGTFARHIHHPPHPVTAAVVRVQKGKHGKGS